MSLFTATFLVSYRVESISLLPWPPFCLAFSSSKLFFPRNLQLRSSCEVLKLLGDTDVLLMLNGLNSTGRLSFFGAFSVYFSATATTPPIH